MCGIAGFWDPALSEGEHKQRAKSVGASISHRGPDGEGLGLYPNVSLVHRRLSIIDVAGGAQPISNEDQKNHIVFNGEIYNYQPLRNELLKLGHKFVTKSDTEVVLHGYEEWGVKTLCEKLNGMFAFAIWDQEKQELVFARDPFGKKPLYYAQTESGFYFASEPRAIVPYLKNRKIHKPALEALFWTESVPDPLCIWEGVHRLKQGSVGVWNTRDRTWKTEAFWDALEVEARGHGAQLKINECLPIYQDCLRSAIERRLMSEVPLGVFLSGGVDSTLVTQGMVELLGPRKVHSFSIGFEHGSFDESKYSQEAARVLSTIHHHKIIEDKKLLADLPRIMDHLDEPLADYSFVPNYELAAMTKQHVTVALGGDGGDELMLGYPTFWAALASRYMTWMNPLWNSLSPFHSLLTRGEGYYPLARKVWTYFEGLDAPFLLRIQEWSAPVKRNLWNKLWINPSDQAPWERTIRELQDVVHADLPAWRKLRVWYLRHYHVNSILQKVDRASMASGLEVRAPILDRWSYEISAKFPYGALVQGSQGKVLLKKMLEKNFSSEFINRPKHGFAPPAEIWLKTELRQIMEEFLKDSESIFRPDILQDWWKKFLNGDGRYAKFFWTYFTFFWWRKRWNVSL